MYGLLRAENSFQFELAATCFLSYLFKFLFFKGFLLVLAEVSFWWGDWALGYHSMKFRQFLDIS